MEEDKVFSEHVLHPKLFDDLWNKQKIWSHGYDGNSEMRNPVYVVVKFKRKNVCYLLDSLRQICE